MFTVNVKIKQSNKNAYKDLLKRLQHMSSKKVAAGYPKGKLNIPHYDNGASIIDVAIWNEFGIGVPRRDFMGPATAEWQKFVAQQLELYKDDLISGKIDIETFLLQMGAEGAALISDSIVKLKEPPNSPVTIALKGGKNNPLVDSGDLSKAPTYELRNKNK